MKKRGQVNIIILILIILIILVLLMIIWALLKPFIQKQSNKVTIEPFKTNIDFYEDPGFLGDCVYIPLKISSPTNLEGLRFSLKNSSDYEYVYVERNKSAFPEILERGVFQICELYLKIYNPNRVSFIPLFKDKGGNDVYGIPSGEKGIIDDDGDGYGPLYDCNDNDYHINPGMTERCVNCMDDNCNNQIDFDDPQCNNGRIPLGVVSYWKFDGNADDENENNEGRVYGNNINFVTGKNCYGSAIDFGEAGYVLVNESINGNKMNPDEGTVSVWFKRNGYNPRGLHNYIFAMFNWSTSPWDWGCRNASSVALSCSDLISFTPCSQAGCNWVSGACQAGGIPACNKLEEIYCNPENTSNKCGIFPGLSTYVTNRMYLDFEFNSDMFEASMGSRNIYNSHSWIDVKNVPLHEWTFAVLTWKSNHSGANYGQYKVYLNDELSLVHDYHEFVLPNIIRWGAWADHPGVDCDGYSLFNEGLDYTFNESFVGQMDDARIFNRELNKSEIHDLYWWY